MNKLNVLLAIGLFSILLLGISADFKYLSIQNTGRVQIETIGIELVDEQGLNITHIDWGTLMNPPTSKDFNCYLKNKGNVPVIVSITTENWSPSGINSSLSLTTSYTSETINASSQIPITFTLSVLSTAPQIDFTFETVIVATQV
jgi:hypothetical protein